MFVSVIIFLILSLLIGVIKLSFLATTKYIYASLLTDAKDWPNCYFESFSPEQKNYKFAKYLSGEASTQIFHENK